MNKEIKDYVSKFKNLDLKGTGWLSLRNAPTLLKKYSPGRKILDFGCGAGRSLSFLKTYGYWVDGADVNSEMIEEAKKLSDDSNFYLISDSVIGVDDCVYDAIFSALVLFEFPNLGEMKSSLVELKRILKDDGVFVLTTGSPSLYTHQWNSIETLRYQQNKNLKSGDQARVYLKNIDLELIDYFWTEEDYLEVFSDSGLDLLEIDYPLGKKEDGIDWKDELKVSPYVTFVLRKK